MQLITSSDNQFHDGNPSSGALGTFLAAAWHNAVQGEIAAPILAAGLTLNPNNNSQLLAAILALIEANAGNYCFDSGVANAYVIALNPAVTVYTNGLPVKFRTAHPCAGPCTLNAGAGAVPLLRDDGQQLQPGDLPLGAIVNGTYDTNSGGFLVNSVVASQFDAILQSGAPSFALDTGVANAYVGAYSPTLTTRTEGMVLRLKVNKTNTTACTFNDGLGNVPLVGLAQVALQGAEMAAGGNAWLQWNSTVGANGSYILLHCTGAPAQVANAIQSQHAVPLGQAQLAFAALTGSNNNVFNVAPAVTATEAPQMGQVQTQASTAFTAAGAAPAYTLTPTPAITVYASPQRFNVTFPTVGTTGSNTINVSGLGPIPLKQFASDGTLASAVITAGMNSDVQIVGAGTYALLLDPLPVSAGSQIMPFQTPVLASGAMTCTLNPVTLAFRSATQGAGGSTQISIPALSLTLPSGANIGSQNAVQSMFVWAVLYNGCSPVLAVANVSGGLDMSETGTISTTAISASATANNVWYSTVAVSNSPYRIVGVTIQTEATAGVYATPPSLVQGAGGEAFAALMSAGCGQTWQAFNSSTRVSGTTYYNPTPRAITVIAVSTVTGATSAMGYVNGLQILGVYNGSAGYTNSSIITLIVPPGGSYSVTLANWISWYELR